MAHDRIDRELRAIKLAIGQRLERARKAGRLQEELRAIDRAGKAWLNGRPAKSGASKSAVARSISRRPRKSTATPRAPKRKTR